MDILLPKSKPILVGSLYRPPDQRDFYELLEGVLNDCLKHHDSKHFKHFCDFFVLKQIITVQTRITPTSVIDVILVSDTENRL